MKQRVESPELNTVTAGWRRRQQEGWLQVAGRHMGGCNVAQRTVDVDGARWLRRIRARVDPPAAQKKINAGPHPFFLRTSIWQALVQCCA
jgi:hypothetical protein